MVATTSCVLKPETMTTPKRMSHQLKAHTRNLNALWKKPNSEPPFAPKRKPIPGRLSPRHKTPNGMAVTIWATLPEQTTTTALPSFKPLVCEKSPKAVNETEAARPIKAHINANRRESWKPNFTEDAESENNAPARAPARISLIRCCLNSTLFAFSLLSFLSLLSFFGGVVIIIDAFMLSFVGGDFKKWSFLFPCPDPFCGVVPGVTSDFVAIVVAAVVDDDDDMAFDAALEPPAFPDPAGANTPPLPTLLPAADEGAHKYVLPKTTKTPNTYLHVLTIISSPFPSFFIATFPPVVHPIPIVPHHAHHTPIHSFSFNFSSKNI